MATTSLPTGPITLLFAEENAAAGRAPARALLTVPGGRSLDGGYDVVVPRELCAGRAQANGNFDIQYLMSDVNQADGSGPSLGALTIACWPKSDRHHQLADRLTRGHGGDRLAAALERLGAR